MSQTQVEIVRQCWEGLEQDPRDLHLEHFAADVEIANPPDFPLTGSFYGHDGVKQWATEVWEVIADLHSEIEQLIEVGDEMRVVSIQTTHGRMRHTEIPIDLRWGVVWTFEGEKIVRAQGYLTAEEALEIAGLSE